MDQKEREMIMREFRSGSSRVLVTTDLLGRGIDVQQVSLVINYDIPAQRESYIHRWVSFTRARYTCILGRYREIIALNLFSTFITYKRWGLASALINKILHRPSVIVFSIKFSRNHMLLVPTGGRLPFTLVHKKVLYIITFCFIFFAFLFTFTVKLWHILQTM